MRNSNDSNDNNLNSPLFEKLKAYSKSKGGDYTKDDFEQYLFWKDNLSILDILAERAFFQSYVTGGETEVSALKRLGQYDLCFKIRQTIKITEVAITAINKGEDTGEFK